MPVNSPTFPLQLNEWTQPYSGSANEANRWSLGVAPVNQFSPRFDLRFRAVGAPYSVEFSDMVTSGSFVVESDGATIVQRSLEIEGRELVDQRLGRWLIPPGLPHSICTIRGSTIHLGGEAVADSPTALIGPYSGGPVEALITGVVKVRAPRPVFSSWGSFYVANGYLVNEGIIELSGLHSTQPVTVRVDREFENRGEIRMLRGEVDGQRWVYGLRFNSGEVFADSPDAWLWVGGSAQNPAALVNTGDVTTAEGAELVVGGLNARFEHLDGRIVSQGRVVFGGVPLILRGGSTEGAVIVRGSILDVDNGAASATVTLEGDCTLTGVVGSGERVLFDDPATVGSARAHWGAGLGNNGEIDLGGSSENLLTAAGPILNRGRLDAATGLIEAPIVNEGTLVLGQGGRVGKSGFDHVLDGTVELDPGARATILSRETRVRGDVVLRPTGQTQNPYNSYALLLTGATIFDGGRLILEPTPAFTPHWGFAYNLVSMTSRSGWFDEVVLPALPDPNWEWRSEWLQNRFLVRVQHIANVNSDFYIDFNDVNAVISAFGEAGGPADLDDSGLVDEADLALVLRFVNTSAFPLP